MLARNFTLFRFPLSAMPMEGDQGVQGLASCRLAPVGPLELSSQGFISPLGRDHDELAVVHGDAAWIAVGIEERILPAAAVNEALALRLEAFERQQGRKPGGRQRKRLKEELVQEMLPRAFVRTRRLDIILDLELGLCAVDTSSRKAAEGAVSEIRRALGSFPALPLNAEVSPRAVLTGWISGDPLPEGFTLGEECQLKDADDAGAAVRAIRQDLASDEIARHLEAGKQVTRLALNWSDHVSFVLGEDLGMRKWRLLDGAIGSLEDVDADDIEAELKARFALTHLTLTTVFRALEPALRISRAEG